MRSVFIRRKEEEEELIVKAEKCFKTLLDIISFAKIFKEAHKFICQPMRETLESCKICHIYSQVH